MYTKGLKTLPLSNNETKTTNKWDWISWGIGLICLLPWLYVQSQAMLNGNVSWLLIAAQRMVHGQSMAVSIYETNPPLSILFYAPHVLFSYLLGLNLATGAVFLTTILIVLSLFITNEILKNFTFLSRNEHLALLFGCVSSLTIITTIYFLDREHLMMMALIPFIFCQYALTYRIPVKKAILRPVVIIGSVALLVKPHYGLLPAIFFLHRMIVQKKISLWRDADFIALCLGTIGYLTVLWFAYQDYIQIIFPDVLNYYVAGNDKVQTFGLFKPHFSAYIAFFCLEFFMEDLEKPKRRFILFIYSCALLSLVPLVVQMKGFYNHLLPAFGFFIMGFSLTLVSRTEKYLKNHPLLIRILTPLLILGLSTAIIRPAWNYPKGSEIPHMPVAEFLDENCPKPCVFFAFHGDIETMNPTALYTGYTHGSRFPSFWFIPEILRQLEQYKEGKKARLSREQLNAAIDKYAGFVANDFENYKPSVLLIGTNIDVFGNRTMMNFDDFFSVNEKFKTVFHKNYTKTGTFEFDRAEYFRGTSLNQHFVLKYDVYKLKTQD